MVRYSVIIPAYNEERTIERAIAETHAVFSGFGSPFEIIVVDDGSVDGTSWIPDNACSRFGDDGGVVKVIHHEKNQGKGAAVRTGVAASCGEIFLFLDADLATHPLEFAKCIPLFASHDIVIGSRRISGSDIVEHQPLYRELAGRLFNTLVREYLALPFSDTQCGFKAFSARSKPIFADMTTTGWVFDVEVLGRAMKQGLRVAEVPVAWKNGSTSRVKLGDAGMILRELRAVKRRLHS